MHRFRRGKFAERESVSAGSRPAEAESCRLLPGVKRTWTCCCAIGNRPRPARAGSYFCPASQVLESHGSQRASCPVSRKSRTPACRFYCSPHHAHSPLYPIIEQLERVASFRPDSSAGAKLARLEHILAPTASNLSRDAAVIADLLAVPLEEHDATPALSPQQKLELTLTVLLEQIEGVAARAPS